MVRRIRLAFGVLLGVAAWLSLAQIPATAALHGAPVPRVVFPAFVEQRAELRVRATREGGGAAPGAVARVYWYDKGRYFFAGAGNADAAGDIVLGALPFGPAWVLVDAPGHARASVAVDLGGSAAAVVVALAPARSLRVRVEDEAHAPVEGATVLVSSGDPLPFGALTDAAGAAPIERLGPAPYGLRVAARGFEEETRAGLTGPEATIVLRRASGVDVTVVDVAGARVPGATVYVAGSGLWPARTVTAGPDGRVRIPGLTAGAYDLKAQDGARVSRTEIGVKVERGAIRAVTLTLVPGRVVPLLVTDGEGEHPVVVPDADVLLVEGGVSSFPLRGRTDRFGKVSLGPIAPGSVMATARAEGFVSRTTVAVPDEIRDDVRIPLLRGATLKGVVVDAADRAVDGASIEVVGTDVDGMPVALTPRSAEFQRAHFEWALAGPAPLIPAGELGVLAGPIPPIPGGPGGPPTPAMPTLDGAAATEAWVTDRGGAFRANPVPPGRVRVLVRHPDYVEGASELVTTTPGATAEVRVVLRSGGAISGHVVDDRGVPVGGARVRATAVHGTLDRSVTSGDDGAFTFAAAPADVILALSRPEDPFREVLRQTVHVVEGKEAEVTLTLPAPREALALSVSDDSNRPVRGAQVSVLSLDPAHPLRQTAFTDDAGSVTVADVEGLSLRVVIDAPGFARYEAQLAAAGTKLDVTLAVSVTVEGHVTAVRGRQDVAGASVELAAGGQRRVALTDALGVFRFGDVSPGPVHLAVSHPDYARAEADATVASTGRADRAFEVPVIDLAEPGSIEGRVVDAAGDPVASARVGIGSLPDYLPVGVLVPGLVTTSADGTFRLERVAPGPQDVEAFAPGLGRARRRGVAVDGGRVTSGVTLQLDASADPGETAATGGVAVALSDARADAVAGPGLAVLQVAPGSEAERGGLLSGDTLVAVDRAAPATAADAYRRLAGPDGSDVVVEVRRGGERVLLRIRRERVRR